MEGMEHTSQVLLGEILSIDIFPHPATGETSFSISVFHFLLPMCSLMAPGADIYDYRVIGGRRVGPLVRDPLVDAIDKAVADGCDIINMSLKSAPRFDLERSINEASEKGVIVVCAAGNDGDNDPLTNEFA